MPTDARPALLVLLLAAHPAAAEDPMSAIDWLSRSVATPAVVPPAEDPVAAPGGALPQEVTTSVLGGPDPDAAGLLPAAITGLPRALWGLGRTDEIVRLIAVERLDALPATRGLLTKLLLAEATPPADGGGKGRLLLARADKLLAMGAIEQAEALLEAAGRSDAETFRRLFDISMLTGTEDAACETLRDAPELAPTFPARIFCLARSGDWNAAALTLRTAQALGQISTEEDALLSRFLDPDLYEGEPVTVPAPMTPLVWRMLEAIGEAPATSGLPLAFAHADLREANGWKARVEAAERLARAGAVAPNLLLGLYTEREPSASGGVWDRVEAFQRLDAALSARDPVAVASRLAPAWEQMVGAELEVPFADLFARDLARLDLPPDVAALAFRIALLGPDYEAAALQRRPADEVEAFLIGLARGDLAGLVPPDTLARAIAPAFATPAPLPEDLKRLLDDGRLGEAVLMAIDRIGQGVQGDLRLVTEGLAVLRHVGLEDAARRTALELMLLERRG